MRWLDQLTASKPNGAYGVSVLKSALAALAAPVATLKPHVDQAKMAVTAVLTTSIADRQGDVIDPMGGDFSEHETNPVVMFHHGKQHKLPIGKAEDRNGNYTVHAVKSADGPVLLGTTYFAQSNRFAQDVFGLVAEDVLRGVSIGFDPLSDPDSVEQLGESPTLKRPALHFKGWKLLEYSHTPIGVNRDALTVAVYKAMDGSHKLHPTLLAMLQPMAAPRKTVVAVTAPARVEKAAMDDDDDATAVDPDDDTGGGVATDDDTGDFDPATDDPSADPALAGGDTGGMQPDPEAPSPTVQAMLDGSQGLLDLASAIEMAMKKSEHMKGRKYATKLCAKMRSDAAAAKKFADAVTAELAGGDEAGDDMDADGDGVADDEEGDDEVETDDDGAIVAKGYTPRRWTTTDVAATAPVVVAKPASDRRLKALETENTKLKAERDEAVTLLERTLDDVEAGKRRRAR